MWICRHPTQGHLCRCSLERVLQTIESHGLRRRIHSRQVLETTRKVFLNLLRTFALIKPDAYLQIGKIVNLFEDSGFTIGNVRMAKLTKRDAENFLAELRGKQNYQENVEFLSSDLSVGLELIADNCVSKLNSLVSSGEFKNSVYTSESANRAAKDIEFFFSQKSQLSCPAVFNSCSCCVIKPHIIT